MDYRPRVLDAELDRLLAAVPAIAIEGAKGVGKTVTAERRAAYVLQLDDPQARLGVEADPTTILTLPGPLLVDEWQMVAPTWDVVRRAVDRDQAPGRFLLTGSAIPPADARMHSGAGRIMRLVMRPMALPERGLETPSVSLAALLSGTRPSIGGHTSLRLADYAEEIIASGFPGLRGYPPDIRVDMIRSYIDRIVEHDIPGLGAQIRRPLALRAWLAAYAAATATTAAYTTLLDAATPGESDKPSRNTADAYRTLLERLWILEPLPAWTPAFSPLRRLGLSPKHHLVDPAIAASLLGASVASLIAGKGTTRREDTLLAALFESVCVQTVRVLAQPLRAQVCHLRDREGLHEIDIIVERDDHRVLAIEVKLTGSPHPHDSRHLRWLNERLGDDLIDSVILTTGEFAYRDQDGIAVIPLALLGP